MADDENGQVIDSDGQDGEGNNQTQEKKFTQGDIDKAVAKAVSKVENDKNVEQGRNKKLRDQLAEAQGEANNIQSQLDQILLQGVEAAEKPKIESILTLRNENRTLKTTIRNKEDEIEDLMTKLTHFQTSDTETLIEQMVETYSNIDAEDLQGKTKEQIKKFCEKYGTKKSKNSNDDEPGETILDSGQSSGKKKDLSKLSPGEKIALGRQMDAKQGRTRTGKRDQNVKN